MGFELATSYVREQQQKTHQISAPLSDVHSEERKFGTFFVVSSEFLLIT